jgi:ABC-2 type transport system ATP-binding protein
LTFGGESKRDFSEFGEVVSQTPVSVHLKVPRAHVTETARHLLAACDVSDINVQEMPIEDVIRQLFGERRSREPGVPSLAASGDGKSRARDGR